MHKVTAIKSLENRTEKFVTTQKAMAYEDEDYLAALEEYRTAHSYRKLIGAMFVNVDRDAALLSREITRRTSRNDREARADRYSV